MIRYMVIRNREIKAQAQGGSRVEGAARDRGVGAACVCGRQ